MVERVHVVGVGGVGMSAIAQALLDSGCRVTGSDRLLDQGRLTPVLATLRGQGVELYPQDGSGVSGETARLVVSTAIEGDNPDVVAAGRFGVGLVHRAAELARLVSGRQLVVVTGTSGKSSVTAMLGFLLEGAGLDPVVINGAAVAGWDRGGSRIGSVRWGGGKWAVVEADESDRSLMEFEPEHVIVTNASADHFGLDETLELFERFRKRADGVVIDGVAEGERVPEGVKLEGWGGSFVVEGVEYRVAMPGMHNVLNAWQAVRMAVGLGVEPGVLQRVLAEFRGVERRLQRVGWCGGAAVVDEYAHNPDKLAAAWQTLAAAFPAGVCGVWRPHGYGPLRKMMDDLVEAFSRVCREQDTLLMLPVYDVGGTADRSVNSDVLTSHLKGRNVRVVGVADLTEAEVIMRQHAEAGIGVVVTLGARDPGLPELARRLAGLGA